MKKLVALLLTVCMVFCMMTTVFAADEKADNIVVLYTNDVHCGVDGYAKLAAYKAEMEAANKYVALVDCGDAVSGKPMGTLSKGEYLIEIMNAVGYDYAGFGNHEFDYGMDVLQGLINKANYQYLCCNLTYTAQDSKGLTGYKAYEIATYGDKKVAFIGVDTPESFTKSTPTYFQDAKGNYVYTFAEGNDGADLYKCVQFFVDTAKADGADYVVVLSHLGVEEGSEPFRSTDLIANTTGIDVVLDGHSHTSMPCDMVANKDGKDVLLSQTKTGLANIGKLVITADGKMTAELVPVTDEMAKDEAVDTVVADIDANLQPILNTIVAKSAVKLSLNDDNGIRLVRNRETAIGDLCADAYRYAAKTDIAFINGGSIRTDLEKGDLTYGDIIALHPFSNELYAIEVTGQQILDALEWSARNTMGVAVADGKSVGENGGFLHVSGLKYTIDTSVASPAKADDKGSFAAVEGEHRIKDVQVLKNGKYVALDLKATYTLASHNYMLQSAGDGYTMFKGCKALPVDNMLDNQVLIHFITEGLKGTVPTSYAAPQGRITVIPTVYTDVADGNWAVPAINYVTEEGIMNGTGKNFDPNGSLTRGQLVTMLYRQAGKPEVEGKVSETFTDCEDGKWYSNAVLWAAQNKIVNGYGDVFKPNQAVTRQEMAKILYGYDVAVNGAEKVEGAALTYKDADAVASWALDGVAYCTANKIMSGNGGNFSPASTTTRAQGAQVFMNLGKLAAANEAA